MARFISIFLLLVISISVRVNGQDKITRQQYIETYANWAMEEMVRFGIPASITLAQGCLESDNGNSSLAREANNHFGIKCHDWQGKKIYHDDDEKNECFRKYKSAFESFSDHSEFLITKPRYASLFELKPDDYKGWARGLKKAGYATSNKYATLLIRIIDENGLYEYDKMVIAGNYTPNHSLGSSNPDVNSGRDILLNNKIEYIITDNGDTPKSLREDMDLYPNEIYRYNDIEKGSRLDSGMIIYLQPKRNRAARGSEIHKVEPGESMRDISQEYGVKMKSLYRKNSMEPGSEPEPGTEIYLRKRKPDNAREERRIAPEPAQQEEETEMEFQFDG